jgi:hypothetical protein
MYLGIGFNPEHLEEKVSTMKKYRGILGVGLLIIFGIIAAHAADNALLGKWKVISQTPNGPLEIEFEFKEAGGKIVGSAAAAQGGGVFSSVTLDNTKFLADLTIGSRTFKLQGALAGDKMNGTWEQEGGDAKGTWSAAKASAPVAAAAGGISGKWDMVAVTPNGDMAATLALTQDGEKITGEVSSEMGSLPLSAGSFKGDKLQFDLDLGGNIYRIQATLKEGKFTGGWAPAGSSDGGPWSATRKGGAAPATATPQPGGSPIVGTWNVVAQTPEGEMRFVAEFKPAGEGITGSFTGPDGTVALQKTAFSSGKLTFDLDYMGGIYRIIANLENDKLSGKWAAVDGSVSGSLSADRKK